MKKIIAISLAVLLMAGLGGCGQQGDPVQSDKGQQPGGQTTSEYIRYSNLSEETSRAEVAALLEKDGLSAQQVELVLTWAREFCEISQRYAFAEGFTPLPEGGVDYSNLLMDDTAAAYSYLEWINCRLTAFSLLKGQLTTARTGVDTDDWLMFDIEAIDTIPDLQMNQEDRADFITLFNQVSVEGTTSLEEHEEKIQQAWKEREIQLSGDAVSLICVYLHAPEYQSRFVGHAGVLAETEEGLLFFEKYNISLPFQATYFRDREELKQYLLSRGDLYGDETELAPIVTENEKIL